METSLASNSLADLAGRINIAYLAVDAAIDKARTEVVSARIAVGMLLVEAREKFDAASKIHTSYWSSRVIAGCVDGR